MIRRGRVVRLGLRLRTAPRCLAQLLSRKASRHCLSARSSTDLDRGATKPYGSGVIYLDPSNGDLLRPQPQMQTQHLPCTLDEIRSVVRRYEI